MKIICTGEGKGGRSRGVPETGSELTCVISVVVPLSRVRKDGGESVHVCGKWLWDNKRAIMARI